MTRPVDQQAPEPEAAPDADELAGPADPGRARRLAWADLFQRVWQEEVLVCPKCGGTMRLVAVVTDPAVVARILRHLRRGSRGPPPARRLVRDSDQATLA